MQSDLNKVWAILSVGERRRSFLMIGLVVFMALAEMFGVISIVPFLSVLARPEIIDEEPFLRKLYIWGDFATYQEFMTILGVSSAVIVILSSAFKTITLHLVNRFTFLLRHSISSRLLTRYLNQSYEFFLTNNPSDLSSHVLSEIDQLQNGLIRPLAQLIAQGGVALAIMILLLVYNPWVAISAAVLIGSLYGVIYLLVRTRLSSTGRSRQAANNKRFQSCNEALSGIRDVKISGAGGVYQKGFRDTSREYSRHQANAETLSQSPLYIVETVGYTGLIVLALILMQQSNDIAQVLPTLGLYGFAAYRLLPSAQIMYRGFAQLKFSSASLDTIHQHLTLPVNDQRPSQSILIPTDEIRLQGISYAYPSAPDKLVLQDFDLVVKANTSVGIIGRSGVGKSTVMDLFLGLLHPQKGVLSVDGIPITAENLNDWQAAIGYVPQHIFLADTSIAENIAFGIPVNGIDMVAVKRAAKIAQIHMFIADELPDGYNTRLGDRGVRLSGGQRQRIGIARALYHDPPVLFFDEATSALDSTTEFMISNTIRQLSGNKTIVLITHREAALSQFATIVDMTRSA